MPGSLELPVLHVEGSDDVHTIINLLARHGITLDRDAGPVRVQDERSDEGVLSAMETAPKLSTDRSVGFVLDANGAIVDRWRAVCGRLGAAGLELPPHAPAGGYVAESRTFKARVGVWIMPDNVTNTGRLEDFVRTLVPEGDVLMEPAQAATDQAVQLDRRFPPLDRLKAVLHCWLAWQEEPGRPFGTALTARYFRHDSDVALTFVDWFQRLFRLPEASASRSASA
jgi:hypothetical protein